jgi:large subunit ribosomal protein L25
MELQMTAAYREETGKGAVHRLRRSGRIPAVLSRQGGESIPLSVDTREFIRLKNQGGLSRLLHLKIKQGKKSEVKSVLVKEVQLNPVNWEPLHLDFLEVALDHEVTLKIPVHITGTRANDGAVIEQVLHEIEISCLPSAIPDGIPIDISGLGMGESILIKDIMPPEGVQFMTSPEEPVVLAAAPTTRTETKEEDEAEVGEQAAVSDKEE